MILTRTHVNKMSNDDMNVIWKKEKLQQYSKESILSAEQASGDPGNRHCQLCRSSYHLQLITNDRLDETLRLYFGVQVPPEGVICQSCIKCMKIIEGFSALVHATFNKTISEDSSEHTRILASFSPGATNLTTAPHKDILSLLTDKLSLDTVKAPRKRREVQKNNTKTNTNVINSKKMIIACTACNQKYNMLMPENGVKTFVCSRCQKCSKDGECKKSKTLHIKKTEVRCNNDLKGKNRLSCLSKKPPQAIPNQNATRCDLVKYQCSLCPKKYAVAENLATHIKTVHEASSNINYSICRLCGKQVKSQDILDKHMKRIHNESNTFQCFQCMKYFNTKKALQVHIISHANGKNKKVLIN